MLAEAGFQVGGRRQRELADGADALASSRLLTRPTPQSRDTGSGGRESLAAGLDHDQTVRLAQPETTVQVFVPNVASAVRLTLARILSLISHAMAVPSPSSARLAVTSRKASSMDSGSTSGVKSARRSIISRETPAYLSISTGGKLP